MAAVEAFAAAAAAATVVVVAAAAATSVAFWAASLLLLLLLVNISERALVIQRLPSSDVSVGNVDIMVSMSATTTATATTPALCVGFMPNLRVFLRAEGCCS